MNGSVASVRGDSWCGGAVSVASVCVLLLQRRVREKRTRATATTRTTTIIAIVPQTHVPLPRARSARAPNSTATAPQTRHSSRHSRSLPLHSTGPRCSLSLSEVSPRWWWWPRPSERDSCCCSSTARLAAEYLGCRWPELPAARTALCSYLHSRPARRSCLGDDDGAPLALLRPWHRRYRCGAAAAGVGRRWNGCSC